MCNCQQLYLFFFGAEFEEPEDFRGTIETLVNSEKLLVPRIPHKAKDISEVPRIPYWANRWFYAEFEEPTFFKIYLSSLVFLRSIGSSNSVDPIFGSLQTAAAII